MFATEEIHSMYMSLHREIELENHLLVHLQSTLEGLSMKKHADLHKRRISL
jgi:hypothetical protein